MNIQPDLSSINFDQQGVGSALSVAGLTLYIKELLEFDENLQPVWVMGEVSSAHQHASGLFFTLSDPEGTASLRCVVWNGQRQKLIQLPQTGEQLIVLGSIRLYPKRGEYQLSVWQALPAGEGLQALRYQQLRTRLEAEGLFDRSRKRSLPPYPRTIAVVTSAQAAAWGDIQRTLRQRYSGLRVLLSPAIVQGEAAPDSIAAAIERVQRQGEAELLILARGGGAVEDLSCFNDERVVRAIATCSIPIITGIGHQRDESLADLVADVAAHTPTAAAEQAVPDIHSLAVEHQQRVEALIEAMKRQFRQQQQHCQRLKHQLRQLPHRSRRLQQATAQCQRLQQTLEALDPHKVLQRGYAVVQQLDGTLIQRTDQLVLGQVLRVKLGQGEIKVSVINIEE